MKTTRPKTFRPDSDQDQCIDRRAQTRLMDQDLLGNEMMRQQLASQHASTEQVNSDQYSQGPAQGFSADASLRRGRIGMHFGSNENYVRMGSAEWENECGLTGCSTQTSVSMLKGQTDQSKPVSVRGEVFSAKAEGRVGPTGVGGKVGANIIEAEAKFGTGQDPNAVTDTEVTTRFNGGFTVGADLGVKDHDGDGTYSVCASGDLPLIGGGFCTELPHAAAQWTGRQISNGHSSAVEAVVPDMDRGRAPQTITEQQRVGEIDPQGRGQVTFTDSRDVVQGDMLRQGLQRPETAEEVELARNYGGGRGQFYFRRQLSDYL